MILDMTSVLDCSLPDCGGVYASAPITSGRRRFGPLGHLSPSDRLFRQQIVKPNVAAARAFVAKLEKVYGTRVIDPSRLPFLEGWLQEHYYTLWGEVVRRHSERAVFLEGWQYSKGCTFEYAVAIAFEIPTFDAEDGHLGCDNGRALIGSAIREIEASGADASFFRDRIADLESRRAPHLMVADPNGYLKRRPYVCAQMFRCVAGRRGPLMLCPSSTKSPAACTNGTFNRKLILTSTNRLLAIRPEMMNPRGWSDAEVEDFWRIVLRRHCAMLILAEGWRNSAPCGLVVELASKEKVKIVHETGAPFDSGQDASDYVSLRYRER